MNFKVYHHRRKDTNEIFYVGHGNNSRPWEIKRGRNKAWQEIYSIAGRTVEILARFETKEQAADFEIKVIADYRAQQIPLVNVKDGGFDRNVGCSHSDEARKKMSIARLNNNAARKKTKTPLGIFVSMVAAAQAHNVHVDTIRYRIDHWEDYSFVC
jgi:hypothetical protein